MLVGYAKNDGASVLIGSCGTIFRVTLSSHSSIAVPKSGSGTRPRIEGATLLACRDRRNTEGHEAVNGLAREEAETGIYDLVILPEGRKR